MEDTIRILNGIIELYHLSNRSEPLKPQCKGEIDKQLYDHIQSLKNSLNAKLFESPALFENIIQYHQEALHHFANSIELENHLTSGKAEIFKSAINEILSHLLTYFYSYINSEKSLPTFFSHYFIETRQELIDLQLSKLNQSGIENNLTDSLKDYLNTFKHHHYISLNYHELVYLQEILLMLSTIYFKKSNIEKLLTKQLLKLNFNHLLFFRYLQCEIQNELAALPSITKKEEFLKLKEIEITDVVVNNICYKEWSPVQQLVKKWIKEELALLATPIGQIERKRPYSNLEKIHLDISVAQLACIVKCFYEEVTHYSVSVKSILQLFTQKVTTKRQTEISYKSLSKCYYAVDQSTAAAVLALLEKMSCKIKKSYFN